MIHYKKKAGTVYYWLNDMEGDKDYWQQYLETVLPGLKMKEYRCY